MAYQQRCPICGGVFYGRYCEHACEPVETVCIRCGCSFKDYHDLKDGYCMTCKLDLLIKLKKEGVR